jgi:import receptor subunit TOM20
MQTSTIVLISVGTLLAGATGMSFASGSGNILLEMASKDANLLAYAVYFDYRRHNDPEFRKALRRNARRMERQAKKDAEAQANAKVSEALILAREAREHGFPAAPKDRESYFMEEIHNGELLQRDGSLPSFD